MNTKEKGLTTGPWSLTDQGQLAELKLKNKPYDLDSWETLIKEAQTSALIRGRMLFEKLVERFPTCGRFWRIYIEQEMRQQNYEEVEQLFQRCLLNVLSLDLWRCYIGYIKDTKRAQDGYREKLVQAYEFALDHIGFDPCSGGIWLEYCSFVKSGEVQGTYAETQKVTAVRKIFQRALGVPLISIEQVWKEYNIFEQEVDEVLAKKLADEYLRQYATMKRCSKEYDSFSRQLNKLSPAIPPMGTTQEHTQLQLWKRYLTWEKSNPTRTEDKTLLAKKVMFGYKQCLLVYGHHPDIWYEAVSYLENASKSANDRGDNTLAKQFEEDAREMYSTAITNVMKGNLLINFSFADFEEWHGNSEAVTGIYESLLKVEEIDCTLVYIQFMKSARRTGGIKTARSVFKRAREDPRCGWQVYVAAALMEYYCSRDKNITFKIFELGMKKHGDEPGYVLAYLDYLMHQTDDNNTRVLYERVLSSMPVESTQEIWEKFMDFESSVGDLTGLIKVEKRRGVAMKDELKGNSTVLLVDRFRYLDLFPCSNTELLSMGYPVKDKSGSVGLYSDQQGSSGRDWLLARPDLNQMMPYKPSAAKGVGMNAVPGGTFPLPTACATMLLQIPPPDCYKGPFVQVDELLTLLEKVDLKQSSSTDHSAVSSTTAGKKRTAAQDQDGKDDDKNQSIPQNDIYRARQQKRVHMATT
ncbi:cleavage stimulation factor subunit 3-like [Dysidea avara]|uniref:cleavage stimulation factor subunit 3-like n=1 Tax=Dysidea avara TaxID=196820 RepID=UPI0033334FF7